jgi:hypothetical protein
MEKRWIAIASMLAGAAIFTVPVQVQMNRRAFTSETDSRPVLSEMTTPANPERTPAATSERSSQANGTPIINVPPVEIRAPSARPDRGKSAGRTPEPCSPWMEISPKYVTDGIGHGARKVRQLC